MAPPLLAMVITPLACDESDTTFWLKGTKREKLLRSEWGNYNIALGEHVAGHSVSDEHAMYTLAGYVAYEGDEDVTPGRRIIDGHFVTYFREGDAWYKADDSIVTPAGTGGTPPTDFPYICIFERFDLGISLPWPPTNFTADETDENEVEEICESEAEAAMEASQTTRNGNKRRRLVGKQAPPQVWNAT